MLDPLAGWLVGPLYSLLQFSLRSWVGIRAYHHLACLTLTGSPIVAIYLSYDQETLGFRALAFPVSHRQLASFGFRTPSDHERLVGCRFQ